MQNVLDDLTIPDILEDNNKNLCNLLASPDDDDGEITILCDSLYYTETDFADYINICEVSGAEPHCEKIEVLHNQPSTVWHLWPGDCVKNANTGVFSYYKWSVFQSDIPLAAECDWSSRLPEE